MAAALDEGRESLLLDAASWSRLWAHLLGDLGQEQSVDAEGEFLGWEATDCRFNYIERGSTPVRPGIVWQINGIPCDEAVPC